MGTKRNNLRSLYKNRIYGSMLGPYHIVTRLDKNCKKIPIINPKLRGVMKANIDYAIKVSKSMNGTVSLKV
jgi:hypothetical protein